MLGRPVQKVARSPHAFAALRRGQAQSLGCCSWLTHRCRVAVRGVNGDRRLHLSAIVNKSGESISSTSTTSARSDQHAFPQHLVHRRRRYEWFGLQPPVSKGRVSPVRDVPETIQRPPYLTEVLPSSHPPPFYHDSESIKIMRETCEVAASILGKAGAMLEPGMCSEDIDAMVHSELVANNAYPSPLLYGRSPFPKSICISVNEVALHGIPDDQPLFEGDIVSLDLVAYKGGYHGDTCRTFIVGDKATKRPSGGEQDNARNQAAGSGAALPAEPSASVLMGTRREGNGDPWRARRLVRATKRALHDAIRVAGPGVTLASIGEAVQHVVDEHGFDTVREFKGHGVAQDLHTHPLVNHFRNTDSFVLKPGLTFTIEPMLVEKSAQLVVWNDGWTAATKDGGLAAQFEHTLLVTDHGVEVLTRYDECTEPWWLQEIPAAWN